MIRSFTMSFENLNFETLYNQYKTLVFNTALNYVQNIEDAEEITQDVFILVHQKIKSFKENASIKTWIYRITINQCINFLKKKNSKKRYFIFGKKSVNDYEYLNYSNFEHPGISLENKENAEILFTFINALPENQKTAFILSKIEDLSNSEVSTIMELSISSIESLIFRAKKSLQEKLENKFEDYRKKKTK